MEKEPERMHKLIANADKMRKGFKALGFNVIEEPTAIVPVIIGEDVKTFVFWRQVFDAGVFVNAFVSPGCASGNGHAPDQLHGHARGPSSRQDPRGF